MDLGDAGAGSCANNLRLGCDCLGVIKYFSGWLNDGEGNPIPADNVICMHEQDGGVGWKHTHRLTKTASVVRARNLILQSIITVGNYEYIFAWMIMQNGNVELEVRATGILSTSLIDPGQTSDWYGTKGPKPSFPSETWLTSILSCVGVMWSHKVCLRRTINTCSLCGECRDM